MSPVLLSSIQSLVRGCLPIRVPFFAFVVVACLIGASYIHSVFKKNKLTEHPNHSYIVQYKSTSLFCQLFLNKQEGILIYNTEIIHFINQRENGNQRVRLGLTI